MSIIGNTLLNEIINQKHVFDPAEVLNYLNAGVNQAFSQTEGINTAGMDVCLIRMQRGEGHQVKLLFTGAKRPLIFVRKDSQAIEVLEGDRKSIGSQSKAAVSFTFQELILDSGAVVYLASDGYVDQNNPQREKLGSHRLKQLITQACRLPLPEQKVVFEKALDAHQQEADQRDDITLIGVKI